MERIFMDPLIDYQALAKEMVKQFAAHESKMKEEDARAFLGKRNFFTAKIGPSCHRERDKFPFGHPDEFRIATLYSLAEEICLLKVDGVLAELGVYRGEFAKHMCLLLPDRKIYLFDTFEGFDETQIMDYEWNAKEKVTDYSKTSTEMVLANIMKAGCPNVDNIIFKKGLFPSTTQGVQEKYALVSIDADLYQPIWDGLNYFYPQLSEGGYIIIHDCKSKGYPGARRAVLQFCKENRIPFVPVPDRTGSIILAK